MKWSSQKLNWQHYELFHIIKKIEKVIYQLELSEELHIHDVFHVSLLYNHNSQTDKDISESKILHLAENSEQKK